MKMSDHVREWRPASWSCGFGPQWSLFKEKGPGDWGRGGQMVLTMFEPNQPCVMSHLWRECRSHWLQTCSRSVPAPEFRGQLHEWRTCSKTCTWSLFLITTPHASAVHRVAIHLLFGHRSLIWPVSSDVVVVAMDTKCYSMRQCALGGKSAASTRRTPSPRESPSPHATGAPRAHLNECKTTSCRRGRELLVFLALCQAA